MNTLIRNDPFDEIFRGFFVRPVEFEKSGASEGPAVRVEVHEQAENYLIQAELPGVRKEDIHVHIDGQVVSISAERKQEKQAGEGERILRTERTYGKVSRSFQLPQDIDEAGSAARYTDGVLELRLPKKVPPQARRIAIE